MNLFVLFGPRSGFYSTFLIALDTLTESARHFDAMGGQEELGAVVALVVVAAAAAAVVVVAAGVLCGEALFPVVRVGGAERVLTGWVAARSRVADEAPDALGDCKHATNN